MVSRRSTAAAKGRVWASICASKRAIGWFKHAM
jgi:hypothetical protein